MQSPVPNMEFNVPNSILNTMNGVEYMANMLRNRLLTPRILQSANELTTYSSALIETIWTQLPSFSRQALQLVYLDFSTLFAGYALLWAGNYGYAVYEAQLPTALSYFVAVMLTAFQYMLFLMACLQKPQSWIHSSVLLLKLPDEWQRMSKEGVPKLDVSCCVSCNKLREIKGDIRSAVLYCFQQLVLSGMRLLPLGTVLSFLPHILMTGRMLAEYRYRTEGVCDRHIEKTYQQQWEFFAVLGLCHFFGVALSTMVLGSGMGIPSDAFEPCVSGLLMLALVRLTYGMKNFPRPVEQAIRVFPIPDPTRWVVESSIDFMVFKFKQNLKVPDTALALFDSGQQKITQMRLFFSFLQTQYQKRVENHATLSKIPLPYLLPTIMRSEDHFFDDPIVGQWCLHQLHNWKNALEKILEYRRLIMNIMERTKTINDIRQRYPVKIALFLFGGIAGTINDIFTLDFMIHRCPRYIQDAVGLIEKLKSHRLLTEEWCQETVDALRKLKVNLEVVKKILNELPESSSAEFFNLLQDWRFRKYLISMIESINGFLVKHHYGLEAMGYDVAETPEPETTCHFPEDLPEIQNGGRAPAALSAAPAAFFAVPPLPKVNSMNEWDDSDRRLADRSQAPLPDNSDDEWDDSDHHLARRM